MIRRKSRGVLGRNGRKGSAACCPLALQLPAANAQKISSNATSPLTAPTALGMLRAVCVPRARLGQRLGSASAPVLELASVTVRTPSGPVAPALRSQVVRQAASSAKAAASTAAVPVAPVNTPLDTDFHGLFTRQAPLFPSPLPPNFVNTYLPHGTDATQNGVLPPLSDDHVRALFTNDLLYPPSGAIEQRAMLRTSIDAGLALRAGKLFDALYHEGVNRFQRLSDLSRPARDARSGTSSTHMQLMQSARLSKRVWDDLINLFLFKAAAVHDEHTKVEFFRRAQILAERMLRACSLKESTNPVYEPNADANTGACLIKGYARYVASHLAPLCRTNSATVCCRAGLTTTACASQRATSSSL